MAVLVDSSVWIASSNPKNPECLKLKRLIQNQELIYVCSPIQTEVSQGARSEQDFRRLWDAFLGFEFLEVEDQHWGMSAWNYYKCRKKGITLSTLDCLIATLSQDYKIPLWTLDRAFIKARPIIGFELYEK